MQSIHKNGDSGAVSVTERSCAVLISKVQRHASANWIDPVRDFVQCEQVYAQKTASFIFVPPLSPPTTPLAVLTAHIFLRHSHRLGLAEGQCAVHLNFYLPALIKRQGQLHLSLRLPIYCRYSIRRQPFHYQRDRRLSLP